MDKAPRLFADRFHDFRMAVTCIRYTNAAGEIEELASIVGVDVRAFRTVGDKIEDAR